MFQLSSVAVINYFIYTPSSFPCVHFKFGFTYKIYSSCSVVVWVVCEASPWDTLAAYSGPWDAM